MVGASAIAALGLLVSVEGASQQAPAARIASAQRAAAATQEQSKELYKKRFRQASPEQRRALAEAMVKRENEARVLCGLTLLQADPSIDASMSKPLSDPTVDPKVRRIEPTICRGDDSIR